MRARPFDPSHLDVRRFAEQGASLAGEFALGDFERLASSLHPETPPAAHDRVGWQAQGECRSDRAGGREPWLLLHARAVVRLTCQRCLRAVETGLEVEREFRFVADEAAAAELDLDAEEDILVESRSFDLRNLIEDELLLAVPLVPRHEGDCPQPLHAPADPAAAAIELAPRDKPFAVLARLKGRKTDS